MTAIIAVLVWLAVACYAYIVGTKHGYAAGRAAALAEVHEARSAASVKAGATRRRKRARSPLFVEGAVPTDSEGAE